MPLASAVGAVVVLGASGLALAGDAPPPKAPAAQAAPAAEKDWTDEWKQPTDWFKWGADERLRHEYIDNPFFLDVDPPGEIWSFNRIRTRLWGTIAPCDSFEAYIRLTNEIRYWWEPDSKPDAASDFGGSWDPSDVLFDNLYVQFKNLFDTKSTLTVGRQDIILGDGWLVLEGTPLDGSRTIYFDAAARLNLAFEQSKTNLDLILLHIWSDPDKWLPAINSRSYPPTNEQDQTGAILYVTNKSLENTQIDGYFIYKHSSEEREDLANDRLSASSDDGEIYTVGSRVVHKFNPNWTGRIEGAYQFGHRENPSMFAPDHDDVSAWGMTSRLTYSFNDTWKNQLWVGLEVLSGDDPDSSTNTQFDPLWGRWPQWSELYIYSYASETRIAETTNLIRPNVGWNASPTAKLGLTATYQPLWAMENTRFEQGVIGFTDDNFRGHLFTGIIRYRFNKHVAAHLLGEYLIAGDFYDDVFPRNDDNMMYLRGELMFTF